jgi:tRNA threonylcarbamoyl adenosine modification protein (Sua5/YciO/YrdC/YwlC family)
MPVKSSEHINIKRLKKDGSINPVVLRQTAEALRNGDLVILPVDNIYAVVGIDTPEMERRVARASGRQKKSFVRLISSYRMLDELASFSKNDYDFLNRIWPGETTVICRKKNALSARETIAVRFPRSRFMLSIIEEVDSPLIFANLYRSANRTCVYRKHEIIHTFGDSADLVLVIEELCRKHPFSSVIDISEASLRIVREGKVSAEEIKSLYFLSMGDVQEF